ncbi:hypothetical protein B0H34DRAFT_82166 [Crassisporium funariophilum]|nr:hypothetical protein B0H34DRAFT_82166 [Crassisporium funariophilum]
MQTQPLTLENHYIRFSIRPETKDALTIRRCISDALTQNFGSTYSSTYIDVLWVEDNGKECVIRVNKGDAVRISAAVASSNEPPSLTVAQESPFLPSLLCSNSSL